MASSSLLKAMASVGEKESTHSTTPQLVEEHEVGKESTNPPRDGRNSLTMDNIELITSKLKDVLDSREKESDERSESFEKSDVESSN